MKILYTGLQFDKYDRQRGHSFEHNNFYLALRDLGAGKDFKAIYFPFDHILTLGRRGFNQALLALVGEEKPDIFFAFMYTDELAKWTLDQIRNQTISLGWFSDDHWRLYNYSRFYAPHLTWAITTYSLAPEIYASYGIKNVIRSQWAFNAAAHKSSSLNLPTSLYQYEIAFVGQRSPAREKIVNHLARAGIKVECFGSGWSGGRVSQEKMVEIFQTSKINLNFNEPLPFWSPGRISRLCLKRSIDRIVPDFHLWSNFQAWLHMSIPQIKARPFEILGCGGFLMTPLADDMENYYENGREIVYYRDADDLIDKIRYYLAHDEERRKIAQAGHERTISQHTYHHRFPKIFQKIQI